MLTFLKFDDEDVYYPPEYGIDDISKWLAEIMTETGITGSLCVMGDKARVMKDRGRDDVLKAMAKHNLISHQVGNHTPELLEIMSEVEWDDGMEAAREYEDRVTKDFQLAFGRAPEGLSRHNVQWSPQHVALAAERGISYQSNFVGVPGTEQPCWYAGAVCTPCYVFDPQTGRDKSITPEFGIHESLYSCDHAFDARFKELQQFVTDCHDRGVEMVHIFGAHPARIRARGYLETRCLAGGKERSPSDVGFLYGVLGKDAEERAKINFRRLCEYLRDSPLLECKGIVEVAKAFSRQPADITRDEMTAHAQEMTRKSQILLHCTFSPAELLIGMAESLVAAGSKGSLPDAVERKNVLGPRDIPTIGPEVSTLSSTTLLRLCQDAVNYVQATGHLPGNLWIDNHRLGIGQLAILVARAYVAQSHYDRYASMNMNAVVRYPDIALNLDAKVRRIIHEGGRFNPDMGSDKLAKHARLQTWTLKPAWLNPPRGAANHEGRIYLNSHPETPQIKADASKTILTAIK